MTLTSTSRSAPAALDRAEPLAVRQIVRTSAADAIRDQLLAHIESGALAVGARLPSEHELAQSFGVSRPVVREGLGALRAAGIVESRSGSGTYVRATRPSRGALLLLGRHAAEDLHQVRCHLEIPGAALAALHRTDEQLAQLERIVARHGRSDDVVAWVDDDLAFHVTLAEASGNELQATLVRELRALQYEQTVVLLRMSGPLAAPEDEHRRIVEAIAAGDAEAARAAMADHLDAIYARFAAGERAALAHDDSTPGGAHAAA